MKLLDYIRGLRKGKEAHRLEKESMKDPFLADAMDGYHQIEGDHEQQIKKLQIQVLAHAAKKKKSYAITWSIAACLVIGIGISSYFLYLKNSMPEEIFGSSPLVDTQLAKTEKEHKDSICKETVYKETVHKETVNEESVKEVVKETVKKEMIAKSKIVSPPQSEPRPAAINMENITEPPMTQENSAIADIDTSPTPAALTRMAQATMPMKNIIKGKVTDEKGEPIIGASITYTGTNIGAVTNLHGEFTLPKKEGKEQLTAQYIGYAPIEISVDTSQVMLIAMNEDKRSINEVVVVGYGKQKKAIVTGSTAKKPQPSIGQRKYKKYLKDHLIRPNDAPCKDVEGEVLVSFFVDKEGNPQHITVKKGLCETADKEAIRLIKEGPQWIPGDQNLPVEITVQF